jgi:hypothetical protein
MNRFVSDPIYVGNLHGDTLTMEGGFNNVRIPSFNSSGERVNINNFYADRTFGPISDNVEYIMI